ncbi:MAG: glycosyltransferase family 4 protein [Deltaproteobacteria bacterium]|nr:glycosyltransferase family 4 protein [Deltaproteobacteria bacterium]
MRIGVNALYLLPGKVGGSEIYVRNLVRWLPRAEGGNEFVVYVNRESEGVFEEIPGSVKVVRCSVSATNRPARILYEQFVLPLLAASHRLDALLSAGMTGPFVSSVPSFTMIYDLQHVNQPQNFDRRYLLFLKSIIYMSAKRAAAVLTLSEKSKRDIVKHYAISAEKVHVTYLASDKASFRRRVDEEVAAVRKKYSLPSSFVLYIASSLPHKNYERLLEAFKIVKASHKDLKLVLIGARSSGFDIIKKKIEELGLIDEVVFLGWLPFEDIPAIYSAADLFVFPSLHEGFGIPVLEAMACGVPVVCSGIEPLDEVAGDAARLVDPLSVESLAEGMSEVLGDRALRDALVKKGLERASSFSWEKTAKDTLRAISGHLGKRARR